MALTFSSLGNSTTGFAIDTGDGTNTDVTLTKEYPAGGYQIASANNNQGLFVFFGGSDGTPAGGSSTKSIVATKAFTKITIIGVTANDLITFTYKETATLNASGTSSSYSGAVVTSFTPNQISSVNDTLILNGAALGPNVTVKFTGANNTPLNAKSITRVSDNQLIVTRPDTMPGDQDPYKITVQNPGIEPAVSTSITTQPLYAGSAPTWSTAATLPAFTKNTSYTQQLIASDPDLTAVTFSFVSGSLPAGLTYAANTSTISGTPTGSTAASFTIRATELSGRYTDRTFVLPNAYPVFTTGATLSSYSKNVSYSTTIIATDDSGVAPSLSVVGTMPNGLSFNASTGSVSGTPTTSTNQTFTIRATDANGSTTDNTFTIPNNGPSWVTPAGALATFSKNSAYSTTLSATDDGTITYSLISGSLPVGVSLNSSSGVVSGTPTSSLSTSFTIRAQDDAGNYVDRSFSIANTTPSWTTSGTLPAIGNGSAYSYQLVATDDDTLTYSIVSGTFPTGITLSSSGLISGTASGITGSTGTLSMVFRVTDTNGSVLNSGTISIPTVLYVFSSHTFTNAGTIGKDGPSLATVRSAYSSTSWASTYLNMTTNGIQEWTVPSTASYRITCAGARGGNGGAGTSGTGAIMAGTFSLTAGSIIKILVGQQGVSFDNGSSSGGGGSFVVSSSNSPLIVAGGGGGNGRSNSGVNATVSENANASNNGGGGGTTTGGGSGSGAQYGGGGGGGLPSGSTGGTPNGGGGLGAGGGAGFGGNGGEGQNDFVIAQSFLNGGVGGYRSSGNYGTIAETSGGFGGGAHGTNYNYVSGGGGGGGYTGGGGGNGLNNGGGGGGGGSYNGGSSPSNSVGNAGHGYVTITKL